MSVAKNKRGESGIKYYDLAMEINENIVKFLLNDMGMKGTRTNDLKTFLNNAKMDMDDMISFSNIVERYHIDVETSYPLWVLEYYREEILKQLSDLMYCITDAYSMFPQSLYEYNIKRQTQQRAIAICHYIKILMQSAGSILKTNFERIIPFISEIDKEIELLKSWRKSGNKLKGQCILNDQKSVEDAERLHEKMIVDELKRNQLILDRALFNFILNKDHKHFDENGKPISPIPEPAIYIVDKHDKNKVIDFCIH